MNGQSPRCQETAGFAFQHPCENPPATRCAVTGNLICHAHAHQAAWTALEQAGMMAAVPFRPTPWAWVSTSVARELDRRSRAAFARGGASSPYVSVWESDPYFYDASHYDPNDFTEADAASLSSDSSYVPGNFESDMQGS